MRLPRAEVMVNHTALRLADVVTIEAFLMQGGFVAVAYFYPVCAPLRDSLEQFLSESCRQARSHEVNPNELLLVRAPQLSIVSGSLERVTPGARQSWSHCSRR